MICYNVGEPECSVPLLPANNPTGMSTIPLHPHPNLTFLLDSLKADPDPEPGFQCGSGSEVTGVICSHFIEGGEVAW